VDVAAPAWAGKNSRGWFVATLALLLALCYGSTIAHTAQVLFENGDSARAIFPPAIAAYAIWERRRNWPAREVSPDALGIVVLVLGAAMALAGIAGGSLTLARLAFLVSLCGCILAVSGWAALRFVAFPLALLLFALPVPSPVYYRLTLPLQAIASNGAEIAFRALGFHAIQSGNAIYLPSQILLISEACSGVQSLVTLTFFCVVYAYWNERRGWARAAIVVAALPASIVMNIIRITATGLFGEFQRKYTQGAWHEALGYVTLVLAFCLIWGAHLFALRYWRAEAEEA
jgi:exosortase